MEKRKSAIVDLALLALAICLAATGQETKPAFVVPSGWPTPTGSTFPGAEWGSMKRAEATGLLDRKAGGPSHLAEIATYPGMLVVAAGRVLFEYGDVRQVSKIASVRKSVLGMLLGNLGRQR